MQKVLLKMILILFFLVAFISLHGVYYVTVNCPIPIPANVQNYDNLPDALYEATHPSGTLYDNSGEVNLKLYGQSYALSQCLRIDFLTNVDSITKLTIEGASTDPNQLCAISGAPGDINNTPGRIFHVYMQSDRYLMIKNLKFVSNHASDINSAAINIRVPKGDISFENNIFDTTGSAIYSEVSQWPFFSSVNIHNNTFYRGVNTSPHPDFDTIHFIINNTGTLPIQFNITNNNFIHALIPIDLSVWCQTTSIKDNHFSVPENSYNYSDGGSSHTALNTVRVYASPHRLEHNGLSQLDFSNNNLSNVSLDIATINSTISNNSFKRETFEETQYAVMFFRNINDFGTQAQFSDMQLSINNNVVYNNSTGSVIHLGDDGPFGTTTGSRSINACIVNNSFFSMGFALMIEKCNTSTLEHSHRIETFRNNLVQTRQGSSTMIYWSIPNGTTLGEVHPVNIDHSWFTYGYPNDTVHFICDATCGSGDPGIIMDENNFTYSLIWNENQKSPLIMAGYGNYLISATGVASYDRIDIGAIQYAERSHEYSLYRFPAYSDHSGIKWISFPTLDRLLMNPSEQNWAFDVFEPLKNQQILSNVRFKLPGEDEQMIYINTQNQFIGNDHLIQPYYGYKFTMSQALQEAISFSLGGLTTDVGVTHIPLYAFQPGSKTEPDRLYENWIGYFVHKTQSPIDAFGPAIANIYSILTQNWFMVRDYNGQWISAAQAGQNNNQYYTLKYGDMVQVKCYTDMVENDIGTFHWFTNGVEREPYEKEDCERFQFEEQPEYIPVYVDLEGTVLPKEVGIYIDGICKGGAKVIGELVEIPAYILEGIPEYSDIEFRLYYESKANAIIPAYSTMNNSTGYFEEKSINLSLKQDYYRVKIDTDDNSNSSVLKMYVSNYPNPFNPSTKIEYYVPESSKISIDIFNVKGQKVNGLCSGFRDKGIHQINWNGKDDNGNNLGSGVYFASFNINGRQITKKMIMLK
jgi:hypothetical protein